MRSRIPIENIYYLLAYAWDRLDEAELVSVSHDDELSLVELFARVLEGGVTHLLKRGLDRAYVAETAELAGVRGRLEMGQSLKHLSFSRGRAWCTYDELSTDTLANRIILTTLRRLASERSLDRRSAEALRDLCRRMPGVTPVSITDGLFRRVRVTANRSTYGFILDVCELFHRNLLVSETSGDVVFRDFTRDDAQMAKLFEVFLKRFYAREQRAFTVGAPTLQWEAEGDPESLALLPTMYTDIVLESPTRTIVMDAKYYSETLTENRAKMSIRSAHLYQLTSYMRHLALTRPPGTVEGVLIYPRVTEAVCVDLTLHGQRVRAVTVDLSRRWWEVREGLVGLVG